MKKLILSLFIIMTTTAAFAQAESPASKAAADSLELNFNSGHFEAIFSSFSDGMKAALPIEKTTAFLTQLQSQAGKITKRQFINYDNSYAVYKTIFERALLGVHISIDSQSKINGFLVKPLADDKAPKLARNATDTSISRRMDGSVGRRHQGTELPRRKRSSKKCL